MSSSNSFTNLVDIDIIKLQETHYKLIRQCLIVLNYTYKNDIYLKTDNTEWWLDDQSLNSLGKTGIIYNLIDIYYLKDDFNKFKEEVQKIVTSLINFELINFIVSLLSFPSLMLGYLIIPFFLNINIFKVKPLIFILTKIYIERINNNLIIIYSRLKATMNSGVEKEFENKIWLIRTIQDCRSFNSETSINPKIFLSLIGFLTAVLPVILKNIVFNDQVKKNLVNNFLEKIPFLDSISWQFIFLLFLYLPTTLILIFFIQSFRTKLLILDFFNIYSLETEIYQILNYQERDTKVENINFLLSLIQLFCVITAAICFIPSILDISETLKMFLGGSSIGVIIACEIFKRRL